jgi:hypothetical protein
LRKDSKILIKIIRVLKYIKPVIINLEIPKVSLLGIILGIILGKKIEFNLVEAFNLNTEKKAKIRISISMEKRVSFCVHYIICIKEGLQKFNNYYINTQNAF